MHIRRCRVSYLCCVALLALGCIGGSLFGHGLPDGRFEGRHTHSIGLTPDGTRLLALNTPDGRLSVFNVASAANPVPVLVAEIPVGLEPVALRARTNDEVWVVNEVGDCVTVVSLRLGVVVATLQVPDEPADVVFAQGKAFVSCARNNLLRVFDAVTRQPLASIPLQGLCPRALATDAGGTKVFAAFLHSGNGTTVLPPAQAPAPPLPTNPLLPLAPQTALIVAASDPRVGFTLLDHDLAEVDAATAQVTRYLGGVGTNLFDVAIQPGTGDPWVANTEARNLVRFEPALRGHVADHRLTRIDHASGTPTIFDMNPGINYALLPNPAAQATALAQPTGVIFSSDGATAWVAAFGSDRVARIDAATGAVVARVELRSTGQTSRQMRGPRALVLHEGRQRLYVLNKIANSISVIGTAGGVLLAEVPAGSNDPTLAGVREGSGFLFDARLSGNGTISCATCHIDADLDGLAWDLGDPAGDMVTVSGANLTAGDPTPRPRLLHPMKGPMTTLTLKALGENAPYQWRGDRATLQDFNSKFETLLGGVALAPADIGVLADYLFNLAPHPNPNQLADDSLPATFAGGDPVRGEALFNNPVNRCAECHTENSGGIGNIDLASVIGATQPIKNPWLRTVYQRVFRTPEAGVSLSGFGLTHDGSGLALPRTHPFALDHFAASDLADVAAFLLCNDNGMAAAVGVTRTCNAQNTTDGALLAEIAVLEAQSADFAIEIAVQGVVGGRRRAFFYNYFTDLYRPDTAGEPGLTRAALLALLGGEDALTFLSVPSGRGSRLGGDRNADAVLDNDGPAPALTASLLDQGVHLHWPSQPSGWVLESAPALGAPWSAVTLPLSSVGATLQLEDPILGATMRFYRLRRTW